VLRTQYLFFLRIISGIDMVTFINDVNKMTIEEYVSRLVIQKRSRDLYRPRVIKFT
jgi:hypothetical protein